MVSIGLNDLNAFANNPLKTYLNKKLGIYLPKEEGKILEIEEPLLLSYLKIDALKKNSLSRSLDEIAAYANNKGYIAPGIYREVALKDLENKITELHNNISQANITPKDLFEIEFSDDYAYPQLLKSGNWGLPALIQRDKSEKRVKITGRIKGVSRQGLLEHAEDKYDIAKFWPRFLLFHTLIHLHQLPIEPQVIFAKTGEIKKPFFDSSAEYLALYLEYYFSALERPSPLISEWVPIFIKEEKNFLKDKLQETMENSNRFYNEYAMWLFKHKSLPDDIPEWKPIAQTLFSEVLEHW
jgi:exodeoxyribonuclease V gamma subunit